MKNQYGPQNGFPDHLTADAWDFDLHAYHSRNMKTEIKPDMEPSPEPESLSLQCDRCGNVTRHLRWRNGETLCTGPDSCSNPRDHEKDHDDHD